MTRSIQPKNVYPIARVLRHSYGDYAHQNKRDPYRELIYIFCSTMTREGVYQRVYASFIRRFPTFRGACAASTRDLEAILSAGGLGTRKAKLLKKIFSSLMRDQGITGLTKLKELDDGDLESVLLGLPGVGKKVARCLMLYSYDRAVFPVDTHCWRMMKRLGWVRHARSLSPGVMDKLQQKIPPRLRFSLHVNMVSHGREICRAINPRCDMCVLDRYCPRYGVDSR